MHRVHAALDDYNAAPLAQRSTIEEQLWKQFGADRSAMILDMSGFSRIVRDMGLIYYLAMVRRMQRATAPLVAAHGGTVVKYEADNLFAAFPEPRAALDCSVAIVRAFWDERLDPQDEGRRVRVSIGIDHGRMLHVPGEDYFGDCVNVAAKLGEDLAAAGQILLSERAAAMLQPQVRRGLMPVTFEVSGIVISALSLDLSDGPRGSELPDATVLL